MLLLCLVRDFSSSSWGNRVESQRRSEPAVTNLDIRRTVPVNPTRTPPSVFALKWQQRCDVTLHPQADRSTNEHAHSKRKCIPRTTGALKHSLAQEVREPRLQRLVAHFVQDARGEEQKAFCCLVVPRSVKVSSVLEHAKNPFKRVGQFVPTSSRVEQGEDVEADDRIDTWPFNVKVRLPKIVWPCLWYVGGIRLPL
jgi:hypothetical protein